MSIIPILPLPSCSFRCNVCGANFASQDEWQKHFAASLAIKNSVEKVINDYSHLIGQEINFVILSGVSTDPLAVRKVKLESMGVHFRGPLCASRHFSHESLFFKLNKSLPYGIRYHGRQEGFVTFIETLPVREYESTVQYSYFSKNKLGAELCAKLERSEVFSDWIKKANERG